MSITIKNGDSGDIAAVNTKKRLTTQSVTTSETQDATQNGHSYNINTGIIGLTSSTESGVIYFKNDESPINGQSDFVVDSIAIGIDNQGTQTGACKITIVRNPTGGTLISGATAVDINQNRNFGSSNALNSTTLAYKGAEGNTVTGGDDFAIFYQNVGTRGFYIIDIELPKGSSMAVKIDTQTTSGTTNLYCALIGHRKF